MLGKMMNVEVYRKLALKSPVYRFMASYDAETFGIWLIEE